MYPDWTMNVSLNITAIYLIVFQTNVSKKQMFINYIKQRARDQSVVSVIHPQGTLNVTFHAISNEIFYSRQNRWTDQPYDHIAKMYS